MKKAFLIGEGLLFLIGGLIFSRVVLAEEGMFLYNGLPLKVLSQNYGFHPSEQWRDHAMRSSVRFNNGGSGSFVSADGLVMTNHHVGASILHDLSKAGLDLYRDGFYAPTKDKELQAPNLELNQLVAIVDVTARVNAAITPSMSPEEAFLARRAAIAHIEKESFDATKLRSDVVTLYQGGQYHLYRYKKYTDVRLVFSPEADIAFFGGDSDNFEFPRFDLDVCFFRVYEDGKPAKIDHFFSWSTAGALEGELVFVSGHPGNTERLLTYDALLFNRDTALPLVLENLHRREALYTAFGKLGEEHERRAKGALFSVQNSRKARTGMLATLSDARFMAKKSEAELELRRLVKATPSLAPFAGAWGEISAARAHYGRIYLRYSFWEGAGAFDSDLFNFARLLVRMADEDLKNDDDRLPEFRSTKRPSLLQKIYSEAPVYTDFEETRLAGALEYAVSKLGADDKLLKAVLDGKSPKDRAAELIRGTKLADPSVRKKLGEGGVKAISQSTDALIRLARLVDAVSREVRKEFDEKIDEVEKQAYGHIANAMLALKPDGAYPDATFTLRLSYGQVKGYTNTAGHKLPAWTTLAGAFDHETKHAAKPPFQLPASWHKQKPKLNLATPFNFVSTNDIIGGNSGSPVFNRNLEVVGLVFDGNIESLGAAYGHDDEVFRAVSVHSAGIAHVLDRVYEAHDLVRELTRPRVPRATQTACPPALLQQRSDSAP